MSTGELWALMGLLVLPGLAMCGWGAWVTRGHGRVPLAPVDQPRGDER